MKEPIKAGDNCEVIQGLGRGKSPNIGKIVKVLSHQGEHSVHGRIWRCEGDLVIFDDMGAFIKSNWADFPQAWLRKIEPDTPEGKSIEEKKELTV